MKDSTTDKVEGKLDELAGKAKEKVGDAIDDPELEAEGTAQKIGGKVQNKVGDIKKVFDK